MNSVCRVAANEAGMYCSISGRSSQIWDAAQWVVEFLCS